MIDWGTVFVAALYGGALFVSAALVEFVSYLRSRVRPKHGTKETLPPTSPPPGAPRRRNLQEQRPPQAAKPAQALTDRRVVRVRLVPRGRNAAART
jgi:hypothetical protein